MEKPAAVLVDEDNLLAFGGVSHCVLLPALVEGLGLEEVAHSVAQADALGIHARMRDDASVLEQAEALLCELVLGCVLLRKAPACEMVARDHAVEGLGEVLVVLLIEDGLEPLLVARLLRRPQRQELLSDLRGGSLAGEDCLIRRDHAARPG